MDGVATRKPTESGLFDSKNPRTPPKKKVFFGQVVFDSQGWCWDLSSISVGAWQASAGVGVAAAAAEDEAPEDAAGFGVAAAAAEEDAAEAGLINTEPLILKHRQKTFRLGCQQPPPPFTPN